ncbi:RRP1 [Mytilus edulis]|uniref:RRP1 n=1 Tax=Mytilus edulis TaxID=6550 RepID=A0A8S3RHY3_MYTED|nr:RRP1 [Mytilus edulis]
MANEDVSKTASVEVHFAQRLASNEKKIRDRAMKKLRKWLELKSLTKKEKAFTEADFLKIWKGLHYCLWMQDKALLQVYILFRMVIKDVVHLCPDWFIYSVIQTTHYCLYKCSYRQSILQWNGTDRWRMDKFMMLFRNMLTQSLEFLKKQKWKKSLITKFTDILSNKIMNIKEDTSPDGLKIHFTDIYLDELERVGAEEVRLNETCFYKHKTTSLYSKLAVHRFTGRPITVIFVKRSLIENGY